MKTPKITKERLHKKDNFRAQVQFRNEEDRMFFAAAFLFLDGHYPANAQEVRDYPAPIIKKKLIQVLNTLSKSNRGFKSEFSKWREENIEEPDLLKKINQIVRDYLDV